jgi:hypothetical protein
VNNRAQVLCAVIDDDPTCREFEQFVLRRYRDNNVCVHRVQNVGHEFDSVEIVDSLKDQVGGWIESRFPGHAGPK